MKYANLSKKFILSVLLISAPLIFFYFLFLKLYIGVPLKFSIYLSIEQKEFIKESNATHFLVNKDTEERLWEKLDDTIKVFKDKPCSQKNIINLYNLIYKQIHREKSTIILDFLNKKQNITCGEISSLYGRIFSMLNYKVKVIQLQKTIFSKFQTHILLDIWDEDRRRWICLDPTYNIYFRSSKSEEPLGTLDIYNLKHFQIVNHIAPISHEINIDNFNIPLKILPDEYIEYWNVIGFYKLDGSYQDKLRYLLLNLTLNNHYIIVKNNDDSSHIIMNFITLSFIAILVIIIIIIRYKKLHLENI